MGQLHKKVFNCMKTIDFSFDNVGGMARMYLLPAAGLLRVDTDAADGSALPVLVPGITIYNIEVWGGESFRFTEPMEMQFGEATFNPSISGFIPRLDNLQEIAELEQGEWICVHQDANGTVLMSGTKDVPLRFVTEKGSGTPSGRNATAFTLQATEAEPSRQVNAAFVLE